MLSTTFLLCCIVTTLYGAGMESRTPRCDINKSMNKLTCQHCNALITQLVSSNRKFCSLSCSSTFNNLARHTKDNREISYQTVPNLCIGCDIALPYDKRSNKFCTSSCSATYSNARKDYSKFKSGPKAGFKSIVKNDNKSYYKKKEAEPKYTKIKPCVVCNHFHPKKGQTCSVHCMGKLISSKMIARIENGWNPNENRNRSIPSYLEKSFEHWLISNNILNYIKNKTFRCNDKWYFGDFFFPHLNLLIELDGSQHLQTIAYDAARDREIESIHGVTTVRISYKEYRAKTKLPQIELLLKCN